MLVAAAMARAADRAYGSVRDPAEGTILTVVREMAARAASEIAHMAEPRLQHRVDDATQNEMLAYVLEHALDAGQASVKRGPELLPILREAGVVDAGGYGLTIIFAGVIAALRGAEPPPLEHYSPARVTQPAARTPRPTATARTSRSPARTSSPSPWIAAARAPRRLACSWSATRTRSRSTSTPTSPSAPPACSTASATVSRLDVADMHEQVEQRTARVREVLDTCGVLAVVNGDGMRVLFEGMGARVLDGGATLNPSTYELLAGIHEVPAEEVVVLPNSPNVRMAAERAAELSREGRPGRPDPLDGLRPGGRRRAGCRRSDARRNAAAMEETLQRVRTGGVTEAARDDTQGRFRRGDSVGFIDEELVAWGEPGETLEVVLGELGREAELLTVIEGDGAPLGGEAVAALAPTERRGRARARRPAGLVVARLRRVSSTA